MCASCILLVLLCKLVDVLMSALTAESCDVMQGKWCGMRTRRAATSRACASR